MTTRHTVARFVLDTAIAAGVTIIPDGDGFYHGMPKGMPRDIKRAFSRALYDNRIGIIEILQAEREGSRR